MVKGIYMKKLFLGSLVLFAVSKTYSGDEPKNSIPAVEKNDDIARFYEHYKERGNQKVFDYFRKNEKAFVNLKNYALLNGDSDVATEALHDETVANCQKEHCDKEYNYKQWQMFACGCATGVGSTVISLGIYFLIRAPQLVWNTVKS